MASTWKIAVSDNDLLKALRGFLGSLLELEEINAILVGAQLPMKKTVMPVLVSDPAQLGTADPLAPCFPLNGAKLVSRLTRKASGGRIAVVQRACEIRAFVELVKLNQARREDLVIVGIDCLGAMRNTDYQRFAATDPVDATTLDFCRAMLAGKGPPSNGTDLAPACKACEAPIPEGADIVVGLYGVDTSAMVLAQAMTEAGEALLKTIGLPETPVPADRPTAIEALVAKRIAWRDQMMAATRQATDSLEKLTAYLAGCVNCYNCRVACPVCYCRECVFVTDVFDHEPARYLAWAQRKGAVKMPTDTVFYHITRLAHMSTACVGCGQCSNACPNDVAVMELFRCVADRTQAAFDYRAGRSIEEKPPLAEFKENEFAEVVGIH